MNPTERPALPPLTPRASAYVPAPPPPQRGMAPRRRRREKAPFGLAVAWYVWLVLLFDPAWWVYSKIEVLAITKLLTLSIAFFAVVTIATRFPKRIVMPSFFAFALFSIITVPFGTSRELASIGAKQYTSFFIIAVGVLAFVRTPRQASRFVAVLMAWQFTVWVILGIRTGLVEWHNQYANYDGYGPLMTLGFAGAAHFGLAAQGRKTKLLAFGTALLCVGGVVSAYQRGAALALFVVLFYMWLRSPHKKAMSVALIGAVAVLLVTATVFMAGTKRGTDTRDSWFAEILSIGDTMDEVDKQDDDRIILWSAAMTLWKDHPMVGVGAESFGLAASQYFREGQLKFAYANPATLYGRSLHNIFVQILTEYGLIGAALFVWMLIDFWWRNRALRTDAALANWRAQGGVLNLRQLALGLECMMVGYLVCGVFYPILPETWFWTFIVANAVLYQVAKPASGKRRGRRKFRAAPPPSAQVIAGLRTRSAVSQR
jgi:O-antigen ligase